MEGQPPAAVRQLCADILLDVRVLVVVYSHAFLAGELRNVFDERRLSAGGRALQEHWQVSSADGAQKRYDLALEGFSHEKIAVFREFRAIRALLDVESEQVERAGGGNGALFLQFALVLVHRNANDGF